jgi:hypothetical protein
MMIARAFAMSWLAVAAGTCMAADWRYALGVHDFGVPDVDSHTFGFNGSVALDTRLDNGRHLLVDTDLFLDRDKDQLDPDHIPLWWQFHLGSDGDFWRGHGLRAGWTADIHTRANTVSSIERQITALPALVGAYDGHVVQASLEAGAGWFFLEIDDDAASTQGYDRSTLKNSTFAYAATARIALRLGDTWTVSGRAREWWDHHQTLETQYQGAVRMEASRWLADTYFKQPALVLSADYYRYNLDVYNRPGVPPILRWNDDLVVRLAVESRW